MQRFFHKKYLVYWLLGLVVIVGAFLRLYHHSDWLHFELDQARDARVISAAIDGGVGELPLQGPRAAGSFLRLGPGFYYLEYASARIFGETPSGMAMFVAILSIVSIPILFFLLRRFFRPWTSLWLTTLFALSPFFVLYGRFAWNPNSLPFFLILGFYGLMRSVDQTEKRPTLWFLIATFAFTLATHMHFLALVLSGAVVFFFLLYKRPRLNWRSWLGAFLIILTLYAPIIINDIMTEGENASEFVEAVIGETDPEEADHNWPEKFARNVNEHIAGYILLLTGYEHIEYFRSKPLTGKRFDIICDQSCRDGFGLWLVTGTVLAGFVMTFFYQSWRQWKSWDLRKKDFVVFTGLWAAFSFLLFLPISYDIAPRFWLIVSFLPCIFLGFTVEVVWEKFRKRGFREVLIIIAVLFIISNVIFTIDRLSQLERSQHEVVDLDYGDKILKERTRVTLGQMEAIVDYMESKYKENGYPVYRDSDSFYERSFSYLLSQRKIHNGGISDKTIYREGNHFLIYRTASDFESKATKYFVVYDLVETKIFGTLTVLYFQPKLESVTHDRQEFIGEPDSFSAQQTDSRVQKRYIWREIFE